MAALTFPLSAAQFFDKLPVRTMTLGLAEPAETSRLADGTILRASLGEALWTGTVEIHRRRHDAAAEYEALLALVARPGASFLIYDRRRVGPASVPSGAGISGVTLDAISSDRREITLDGFASAITAGDLVGYTYGSGKYALHRAVVDAASGAAFEVVPRVPDGVTAGASVSLVRPPMKAVLSQPPAFGEAARTFTGGLVFDFVQTLR